MSRTESLLAPLFVLVAIRGGVYTLLSAVMVVWWVAGGFGTPFGANAIPWWSVLPAAASLAGSLWLHRLLRRGHARGFLAGMLATEVMLWMAVITLGIRAAFLLWGLAQLGAIVLILPVAWMELQLRVAQGFDDPEVRELGAEYATVFALGFAAIALFVGAVSGGA